MESTAGNDARSQLAALARSGVSLASAPPRASALHTQQRDAAALSDARRAAVLVLFGMLQARASHHAAQARSVSRELDVLLLVRSATVRSHPSQVAFPGGRLDHDDEAPVAAALREAQEETGLDPSGVEILGALGDLPLERSRHLVTPVLAWWRRPSPIRVVDVAESAVVFRAPVADLLDPANRGSTVLHRDGHTLRGPAFLIRHQEHGHLVWGFTAMVLDGIFERLSWTEPWDRARELPLEPPAQSTDVSATEGVTWRS